MKETKKKTSGRGGAREGSGRKKLGSMARTKTVAIVMSSEQSDELKRLAAAEGISVSKFVSQKIFGTL